MGFSLVGNSGDTKTTQNYTSYSGSLNPQFDLQGAGAGASAFDQSPLVQGGQIGNYAPAASSFYNPVNVVISGDNYGDSALQTIAQIEATQTAASEAPGNPTAASAGASASPAVNSLSSLISSDGIYLVFFGVLLFLVSHHRG